MEEEDLYVIATSPKHEEQKGYAARASELRQRVLRGRSRDLKRVH